MVLSLLLVFVPLSLGLKYLLGAPSVWIFIAAVVAVAVLAEWIRRATEQLAERVGPAVGGLLTVSFGSIAELVLALFVLASGETAVVQAQITGSIIGTSLFGLGLAIVIGGSTRERQSFNPRRAGLLSTLLVVVVIAMLLPAVFNYTGRVAGHARALRVTDEELSLSVSAVLLLLYVANLIYTLITHRDVFAAEESLGKANWSLKSSLAVIIAATVAIALEAELVSGALAETASALRLSPLFLGVIVLGLVGTIADLFAAAWFAHKNKMGLVLNICVGSAIQVALVVAPLLVMISWFMGRPMNLVFSNPLHLFAIAGTALIVNAVARDGETTWFEGLLLLGVYVLFGLSFFFTGSA
ncbi:cation transporter [Bradyrhizobium sp. CCBAU 11434]|uniref:calcium/proton exchanger n=1 Tax=Bradyrhizobium sp. CCBAU 11434 TaxID=1630885 RepID=UPI00230592B3|nr:calcium/proton exchanger [Bradyrhizobium sp. CCBAU 11434]MDA9522069.1 cation transporter [Bradyrhizobium sp. CCBAU 11434]